MKLLVLSVALLTSLIFIPSSAVASDPSKWINITIEKLEGEINSSQIEVASCFNPSGDTLFFSTKRGSGLDQIWGVEYRNGKFSNAQQLTKLKGIAVGAVTMDARGLTFVAMLNTERKDENVNNIDIYEIDYAKNRMVLLPATVNSRHFETQPHISQDGSQLLFASTRENRDDRTNVNIYESLLVGGKWSQATLLGPEINTTAYEGFPTLSHEG